MTSVTYDKNTFSDVALATLPSSLFRSGRDNDLHKLQKIDMRQPM